MQLMRAMLALSAGLLFTLPSPCARAQGEVSVTRWSLDRDRHFLWCMDQFPNVVENVWSGL